MAQSSVEPNPAIYGSEEPIPTVLALVTNDGVLRQQRVISVAANPVQYEPAKNRLTVYETLRVEVTFTTVRTPGKSAKREAEAYDDLLTHGLLNGYAARAWRADGASVEPMGLAAAATSGASLPWTPPAPAWRVSVQADGLYRITRGELSAAGLPVETLDPRSLQLFHLGSEVPIQVAGESDGKFGADDEVRFYGQAIHNKYTADNVYWLTYGKARGLRMAQRSTTSSGDLTVFGQTELVLERDVYYWCYAPGDEALERWFWDYIYRSGTGSATWSYTFQIASPYSGNDAEPGTIHIVLLGYNNNKDVDPDHHAAVSVNGTQLGDILWDGVTWANGEFTLPAGLLQPGENNVAITLLPVNGVSAEYVYIDRIELDYSVALSASANLLAFSGEAGVHEYHVAGFDQADIVAYDITSPDAPIWLNDVSTHADGGGYTADLVDAPSSPTDYIIQAKSAFLSVKSIDPDSASTLWRETNGADYIVITPRVFWDAAEELSRYRADSGMRVMLVDVQDVYDEFGYGIIGAAPIHEFLAYTYNHWQAPAPSYVVLVGDGHYDPKNHAGFGRTSYIPPYLAPADPWVRETAADNRYVTIAGEDTLPDMMLGRLSVNSRDEASAFVNKIEAYEQNPPGNWQTQVLAVADNADSGGAFDQLSDALLASCLPGAYSASRVYYGVTHTDAEAARAAIQTGINAGKLLVNYIGHASYWSWANEDLLTTADVSSLSNGTKLPVVVAMTCREGAYQNPGPYTSTDTGDEALGEVVTRAEGRGAVASWSPTGLGVTDGHDSLNRGFYDSLFRDGSDLLGDATAAGKLRLWSSGRNLDLLDTYVLFGDPLTHVPLQPTGAVVTSFVATGGGHTIALDWTAKHEVGVAGYNIWRDTDPSGANRAKLNSELVPVADPPGNSDSTYQYIDAAPVVCTRSYYWLEVANDDGTSVWHDHVADAEPWCRWVYEPVAAGAIPSSTPGPY